MRAATLLVVSAIAVAVPTAVSASQGVAVDVGEIDVDEPLRPGQRYSLPTVGVRNPGTEAAEYRFFVQAVSADTPTPDERWFRFSPATFSLGPDEKLRVSTSLALPDDVPTGAYEALLTAQVDSPGEGASVGVAAAARLRFTVGEAGAGSGGPPDWRWAVAGLVAASVTVRLAAQLRARRAPERV